jgi:AcrR family transcriptional regulator
MGHQTNEEVRSRLSDLIKEQILEEAARHFLGFGYAKVTTDSLASSLGISKKTLYKYFPSKKVLLSESMHYMMEQFGSRLPKVSCDAGQDFAVQFHRLLVLAATHIAEVNLPILQYLQQKAPELWAEIESFREQKIAALLNEFWEKGVKDGKIKPHINHETVLLMFISSVRSITNENGLFPKSQSRDQIINNMIDVLFYGIFGAEHQTEE